MGSDSTSIPGAGRQTPGDELLLLWQREPATAATLGEDVLRARAAHVARARRRLHLLRNVQHVGSAFGLVASTVVAIRFTDPPLRWGAALLALTFAFRWMILRRMPPRPPADLAAPIVSSEPSLVAYRAALIQRLDEDRGVWLWSRLAIGGPAAALLLYGLARAYPALKSLIAVEAVAVAAGLAVTFRIAVLRARRCQTELDALDALETLVEPAPPRPET